MSVAVVEPENWAPVIRERLEAVGCTLEGLPGRLSRTDGLDLLNKMVDELRSLELKRERAREAAAVERFFGEPVPLKHYSPVDTRLVQIGNGRRTHVVDHVIYLDRERKYGRPCPWPEGVEVIVSTLCGRTHGDDTATPVQAVEDMCEMCARYLA